ncbi:MAG: hypothetical protein OEY17_02680 [Nitrosopumilus sp.]|nr:hypothetical protein [Nitrosopumilus sp.]MDH5658236.1 hypothetical protein [Nitrosopumilus sp.]
MYGELAGINNYHNKIDVSGKYQQGSGNSNKLKFGDEKGNGFDMRKR